jgi:hypothetical protein
MGSVDGPSVEGSGIRRHGGMSSGKCKEAYPRVGGRSGKEGEMDKVPDLNTRRGLVGAGGERWDGWSLSGLSW